MNSFASKYYIPIYFTLLYLYRRNLPTGVVTLEVDSVIFKVGVVVSGVVVTSIFACKKRYYMEYTNRNRFLILFFVALFKKALLTPDKSKYI